jgi:hypothetical protein
VVARAAREKASGAACCRNKELNRFLGFSTVVLSAGAAKCGEVAVVSPVESNKGFAQRLLIAWS